MILLVSMDINELRSKHPVFHYQSYDISETDERLDISFNFLLEPDIRFQPKLQIPLTEQVNSEEIRTLIFNLGMVEAISYWKAACPAVLSIEAGFLNNDQISWWHDLFIHGLGEFYYRNKIDFTLPDFLEIKSASSGHSRAGGNPVLSAPTGDLILVGGGKDSVVSLELTKKLSSRRQVLLLNPNPAMLNVARLAGFSDPLIVKRSLDPQLLDLNKNGYLNGHTPFSAYLAFLSLLVGKIYNFKHVIASNEESASVGNTVYHDLEINHQYSKSFRFEERLRDYRQKYLPGTPEYFSLLRPLSELQIAMLFAQFRDYFQVFNSCNVGRGAYWCGKCPKCVFIFLILAPFVPTEKLISVFGKDLLDETALMETFLDLVGIDGFKPFDCVGTKEESVQAVSLAIAKYNKEGRTLPRNLVILKEKLKITEPINTEIIMKDLKSHWNSSNFLPEAFEKTLKAL